MRVAPSRLALRSVRMRASWSLWTGVLASISCGFGGEDEASTTPRSPSAPVVEVHGTGEPPNASDLSPEPAARAEALTLTLRAWLEAQALLTVRVGPDGGRGSGVLVSREGEVLTAAHVVEGVRRVEVTLPGGERVEARVIARDEERDLALLATSHEVGACAPIDPEAPEIGRWVLVTGFPGSVTGTLPAAASLGLVLGDLALPAREGAAEGAAARPAAVEAPRLPRSVVLTSAHLARGMSGGPAMGADGRLVGIVVTLGGLAGLAGSPLLDRVRCDDAPLTRVLPPVLLEASHGEPDRDASLAAVFAPDVLASSRVAGRGHGADAEPVEPTSSPSVVRFHTSGRDVYGVVVGPGLVLTLADRAFGAVGEPGPVAETVTVTSDRGVRVVGPIEIRGELAVIRVEGLRAPPIELGAAAPLAPGALLAGREQEGLGVVSSAQVSPGTLRPYVAPMPPGGCGTLHNLRFEDAPVVELSVSVAHDARAVRGELLVDASGAPVAMHLGHHVEGLGYAVPLTDARDRFDAF